METGDSARPAATCRSPAPPVPLNPFVALAPLIVAVALGLPGLLGCSSDEGCGPCPGERLTYTFSFEDSLEGWTAKAIDIDDPPVTWSIKRSSAKASDETTSVELYLENYNDQGKIWIERAFQVKPNTAYHVHVGYDFATADWGVANHWRIIAGAADHPAADRDDLVYQDYTNNDREHDDGFVWLEKSYACDVRSGSSGLLYAMIGVWGIWETPRTYYVDAVRIEFTEE